MLIEKTNQNSINILKLNYHFLVYMQVNDFFFSNFSLGLNKHVKLFTYNKLFLICNHICEKIIFILSIIIKLKIKCLNLQKVRHKNPKME